MEDITQKAGSPRTASLALIIGIVVAPVIFAWVLLGKGYSNQVRTVGFGWMAIFTAVIVAVQSPSDQAERADQLAPVHVKPASAGPMKAAAPEPDAGTKHINTNAAEEEFRRLYEDLQGFRHDKAFLDVGFDRCCRFHQWQVSVQKLDQQAGASMLPRLRVTPGDLQTLGFEYLRNKGRSSELAADLESRLHLALYPPQASAKKGIINELSQGCRSFELLAQFFRLTEEGAYSTADSVLYGPGCEKILAGTRTGPVLRRQSYHFSKGGSYELVLVQLSNGHRVWLGEDEVDFR